ncbi:hypothetical protein [Rhizobium leguminosarum]|uniref:hypothetical protein n=1 Tax=Rhizobium leguminosarum TaxID=384 RepID=UPI000F7B9FB4|nr:hypothetical protein [Rhizobium leguminosarum]
MKKLLVDAVAAGNATARGDGVQLYPNSAWSMTLLGRQLSVAPGRSQRRPQSRRQDTVFLSGDGQHARHGAANGRRRFPVPQCPDRPERRLFEWRKDLQASHFPPMRRPWTFGRSAPQTRSQLKTSQTFPSENNKRGKLIGNSGGERRALARGTKLLRFRNPAIFATEGPLALRRHSDGAGVCRLDPISEAEELLSARPATQATRHRRTLPCSRSRQQIISRT